MKKVLFALCLLVSSHGLFAQVHQGNWLVGGNIGFTSEKHGDAKETYFQFSPNAGYFFIDQFAGGLRLTYSSDKPKGADAYTNFVFAPFLRYYFLPAAQKVNVFADGEYGFGKAGQKDKASLNEYQFSVGPAVFLNQHTALEFGLYYKSYGGDAYKTASGDRDNYFGLNIGLQVHLGK
jgi:hypothetical protein